MKPLVSPRQLFAVPTAGKSWKIKENSPQSYTHVRPKQRIIIKCFFLEQKDHPPTKIPLPAPGSPTPTTGRLFQARAWAGRWRFQAANTPPSWTLAIFRASRSKPGPWPWTRDEHLLPLTVNPHHFEAMKKNHCRSVFTGESNHARVSLVVQHCVLSAKPAQECETKEGRALVNFLISHHPQCGCFSNWVDPLFVDIWREARRKPANLYFGKHPYIAIFTLFVVTLQRPCGMGHLPRCT